MSGSLPPRPSPQGAFVPVASLETAASAVEAAGNAVRTRLEGPGGVDAITEARMLIHALARVEAQVAQTAAAVRMSLLLARPTLDSDLREVGYQATLAIAEHNVILTETRGMLWSTAQQLLEAAARWEAEEETRSGSAADGGEDGVNLRLV